MTTALRLLLQQISPVTVRGAVDRPVEAVVSHSDDAVPGSLFVAVRGRMHDGHTFVGQAVARGATVVVVERPVPVPDHVTQVVVEDSRRALAELSAAWYGHPSRDLTVVGITGTNGKGTTAHLLEAALTRAGYRTAVIGTLGVTVGAVTTPLQRTTPEAPELQGLLRRLADGGVQVVAMEVASHGLVLHRVTATRFRGAVFTNLTQDHLDFHGTLDAYREAKARLFRMVEPSGFAVVNADDPSAEAMARASRAPVTTYGVRAPADVRATDVQVGLDGVRFVAVTGDGRCPVRLRLRGRFNVSNALAALAAARALGVALEAAAAGLEDVAGVPGRFEAVDAGQPFAVIVDYAHTPDGLRRALEAARDLASGRVVVVFGCGGDRDRTKRPVMGRIACELADRVIVTSDNPRSEDPMAIIEEILAGTRGAADRVDVEPDRRAAIYRAVALARPGDVVLIAGKGHEPYQEIAGVRHPFDDRRVAAEALRAAGAAVHDDDR
ncbi:MAG: UDP-N-acetylmuramoyl-L-alanyl-D-glutamate--2,6-diaminopimelate ligase [Armatimonadota bacterium]|nr:UDP-N-acetylmuramoyl-L-alanyl-D-glutamate--2,6-diaminopimelate ligase [Armatimonadota bacterium]MDR7436813.1 UDP-N-acetylmuramoyl-L-alanyl-D-glutamate--2,6-diaminopimelate ligase [Armatimonadota bacterium]MDR7472760.1 UDP-N-acetylmuramoyl-L-alanyl-D-glutamate--2,6-diaminopimelate ligase [Armatimonadota bacterium]MDR7507306.1 UDP-N-acetylmuramoyl-L-alanyl-D-glutamate--2,6-diaminopimelate ligase [Armatimonadota bacterium]MDR7508810.1 UDP-N-acetylmuramoyl-L-alanyl-D-glutamate--2,6-diaminopimela